MEILTPRDVSRGKNIFDLQQKRQSLYAKKGQQNECEDIFKS